MLHKDPNQRYASYGELIDHFQYAIDTLTANAGKPRAARQRVVVESESQNHLAGALTLLLLVLLVAGGVGGVRLPRPALRQRRHQGRRGGHQPAGGRGGRPARARRALRGRAASGRGRKIRRRAGSVCRLAQRKDLPHPLDRLGQAPPGHDRPPQPRPFERARRFSAVCNKAACIPTTTANAAWRIFSSRPGRYLADAQPIPASAVKNWNVNTFDDMGLLLFGLKDWEMGRVRGRRRASSRHTSTASPRRPTGGSATTIPSRASASTTTSCTPRCATSARRRAPTRRRCARSTRRRAANCKPRARWSRRSSPPRRNCNGGKPPVGARRHGQPSFACSA